MIECFIASVSCREFNQGDGLNIPAPACFLSHIGSNVSLQLRPEFSTYSYKVLNTRGTDHTLNEWPKRETQSYCTDHTISEPTHVHPQMSYQFWADVLFIICSHLHLVISPKHTNVDAY